MPGAIPPTPLLLGAAVAVALTILFQVGAVLCTLLLPSSPPSGSLSLPGVGLAQVVTMLIPTLLLAPRQGPGLSPLLRIRAVSLRIIVVSIVGTMAMWGLTQTWLLMQEVFLLPPEWIDLYRELTFGTQENYTVLFGSTSVLGLLAPLLVGGLIPALSEEVLFRGFSQSLFEQALSPTGAITLAAFLFALLHLQPFMFLPLMALGFYFGYLAWRTGSIIPPVIGHFLFNAVSLVTLHDPQGKGDPAVGPLHTADDLVVMLPITILSSLAIIGVSWWMERNA